MQGSRRFFSPWGIIHMEFTLDSGACRWNVDGLDEGLWNATVEAVTDQVNGCIDFQWRNGMTFTTTARKL